MAERFEHPPEGPVNEQRQADNDNGPGLGDQLKQAVAVVAAPVLAALSSHFPSTAAEAIDTKPRADSPGHSAPAPETARLANGYPSLAGRNQVDTVSAAESDVAMVRNATSGTPDVPSPLAEALSNIEQSKDLKLLAESVVEERLKRDEQDGDV